MDKPTEISLTKISVEIIPHKKFESLESLNQTELQPKTVSTEVPKSLVFESDEELIQQHEITEELEICISAIDDMKHLEQ